MSRMDTALKYFNEYREEMEPKIKNNIEQYRKGDVVIKFNSDTPLSDDTVIEVEQISHEFRFGANLFMLDEFETEEKNKEFRQKFPEIFNLATLPFYWNSIEPEKGKFRYEKGCLKMYRRPAIDLCIEYCDEKGIEPKAHCLNYDYFSPKWLHGASVEEQKEALEKRFRELSERYADKISCWEVTNETFNIEFVNEFLDKNHYSKFYREKDFNKWSFLTADKYFHNNSLMINDHLDFGCMRSLHGEFFGHRSPYYAHIEQLLNDGIHLDSIGFQFHCFFAPEKEEELAVSRYNPQHIYKVLDTYASLGKKIQITEMTISAFENDIENEEVQAELVKNLYSVFFSHPAMEAIIYWNIYDGYASGVLGKMKAGENFYRGGLCDFDMREKPAYKVLKKLVNEVWHTSLRTKLENGSLSFRGFYGDYRLKIHTNGEEIVKDITLSSKGNNIITLDI